MLKTIRLFVVLLVFVAVTTSIPVYINPSLTKALATSNTVNIIVRMESGTQGVLNKLNQIKFQDRAEKLNTVANTLKTHAAKSQSEVLSLLSSIRPELNFRSFWITNEIFIPDADIDIIKKLSVIEGIAEIHEEYIAQLPEPLDVEIVDESEIGILAEPGVEIIQAQFVWSEFNNNGTGAVVAGISTGVRGTHVALRDSFLGKYGWFDPANGTYIASDSNGLGTHTMGTVLGGAGIGVAPGAKWMACRACATRTCQQSDIIQCAEFVTCPTLVGGNDPDCSKAPHIVSNSWVGNQGDTWFDSFIQAWKTAGIIPVFANGDYASGSGQYCYSARSPADSIVGVIAVGATTNFDDSIASISGYGPSYNGLIKPDITAPGQSIRSAYYSSDTSYTTYSGTAQATQHVAGVLALLVAENGVLTNDDATKFLYQYTDTNTIIFPGRDCGDLSEHRFPNNAFGWGRINAFKSVRALRTSMMS